MAVMMKTQKNQWISMIAVAGAISLLAADIGCSTGNSDVEEGDAKPVAAACDADAKPAPDFTMKDMNGGDVKLASFKGKIVLVNFWATWCGPCKAEIPHFVELQKQYADDVQFLGVSVDDKVEDLKPYVAEYKMNYPVLLGLGRTDVEEAYGPLVGIPQTFVISREGMICKKHAGIAAKEKFEQEIKGLL